MKIIETAIPDVRIIIPQLFSDARGYFLESWNAEKYEKLGISCQWVQDNESSSVFGVLRGLHYQIPPYTQAKLVRVIQGSVLDVSVDLRQNSPTFGQHIAVELTEENRYQLYIPRGFAHGFAVLSEKAVFAYKCDNRYMPSHERGIAFDDPALGIDWRLKDGQYLLSGKDRKNPPFKEAELFDFNDREYLQ